MTNPDPGRETRIVPVQGRNIVIRQLIDTQMMLLNRGARLLQRDDIDKEHKLATVDRMLTILESVVVQPEDSEYMEDLMARGKLGLKELMSFVTAFNDEQQPAEKPKVRRGRPAIKRS
jgi:hypothetical protein